MLISSSLSIDLLLLTSCLIFALYKYFTRKFDYWEKRGVVGPKPTAFVGNFGELFYMKVTALEWLKNLGQKYDKPYFGIFTFDEPCLVIRDPVMIKDVLIKNFANFPDRSIGNPEHDQLVTDMLFIARNPKWKINRSKISPAFTSTKLKGAFQIINQIGDDFLSYLKLGTGDIHDIRTETSKYALEVISQYIFGIKSKCFETDSGEFYKMAMGATAPTFRNIIVQLIFFFRQNWVNVLKLNFIKTDIIDYFNNIFMQTLRLRESGPRLNDFIDMIKDLEKDEKFRSDAGFEGKKVGAQALHLFMTGHETTTMILSFLLYEICLNQEIQDKLRAEIEETLKKHTELSYESLSDMKYLDMCVSETLRKYPVLPFLDRTSKSNYKLPGSDLVIEKGLTVYISIADLHYNEAYFPEADRFIPERFGDDCSYKVNGLVYFPFGEGPRICIGERFALMSIKIVVCKLLTNFRFSTNSKTPKHIKMDPKSVFPKSVVGLPMTIQPI